MKKLLGIVVLGLLWCNISFAVVAYNEPLKRIYILGELTETDHYPFRKYANEAESVFLSFPGGARSEEISKMIVKNKLPVFVGRMCYSACTIISLSSHALYASEDTMFMFHEGRKAGAQSVSLTDWRWHKNQLMLMYRRAGSTKEFTDKVKEARKKDTSRYDQNWELWVKCKDVKKYFKKNKIFCDSISSTDGIKFIVENNPILKNVYCSNKNEKTIIKVFFNPGCPEDYKEIKKNEYALLKESSKIISENSPFLEYHYNFNKMDTLIHEIGKLSESGITFSFDEVAKKHGFKSFKDAVGQYKKRFKVRINVEQAKSFFEKVDLSFKIDYSQKNLDKLHYLIFNDKYFLKRNLYLKEFKTGVYKGRQIYNMNLAAYINVEKEMARITKNPNLKAITRFTWFTWFNSRNREKVPDAFTVAGCTKSAKKYKLIGGKCIIVDERDASTGEIINRIKKPKT